MKKFATGLIAGGIIGAVGVVAAMSDRRNRKYIVKNSKKAMKRAEDLVENVTDMF